MSVTFTSAYVERTITHYCEVEHTHDGLPGVIRRVEVTIGGGHSLELRVTVFVDLPSDLGPWAKPVDYMSSDVLYGIARQAARETLRHFKVKGTDLSHLSQGLRLVTMTRAEHQQVRAAELAQYRAAMAQRA